MYEAPKEVQRGGIVRVYLAFLTFPMEVISPCTIRGIEIGENGKRYWFGQNPKIDTMKLIHYNEPIYSEMQNLERGQYSMVESGATSSALACRDETNGVLKQDMSWIEMVKKFSKLTDKFLFDEKSFLHGQDIEREINELDVKRDKVDSETEIIMDAKSLRQLAGKIVEQDKSFKSSEEDARVKKADEQSKKDIESDRIYEQLQGKTRYLKYYFGIVTPDSLLSSSELALVHILYETEKMVHPVAQEKSLNKKDSKEKPNKGKGKLNDLLEASFLRFYQNNNPYYEYMIFIKACLLQKISFKEAYCCEYVRGLIYFGVNAFEDQLYNIIKHSMQRIDEDTAHQLEQKSDENHMRRLLCNHTRWQWIQRLREFKSNKEKYRWDNPVSDISDEENNFIQAYYHFSKLGVRDVINQPILSQVKERKQFLLLKLVCQSTLADNITSWNTWRDGELIPKKPFYKNFPRFSCWEDARKDLEKLKNHIKENSKVLGWLVVGVEPEFWFLVDKKEASVKDKKKRIKNQGRNIKNHAECYIGLCEFIWQNKLLPNISEEVFLIIIYLYEYYSNIEEKINKPGFRAGEAARREMSIKTILSYFKNVDRDFTSYQFDNIPGKEFCDVFYGIVAFCNAVLSFSHEERNDLVTERKKMKRALYKYFNKMIPLLKQHDYPFPTLNHLREELFPEEQLKIFCEDMLKTWFNPGWIQAASSRAIEKSFTV
ncbi:hypothetical protein KL86SPO_50344 [uncultured Sporomusa sp.]|uniref:Uncharacterized protein n=1 Tax=uncultured Sporomusa sp. TaxID=307249 RepID=A0A212LYD1_9FIRM|nr:hypothetical protein [uncultured Sporomusa sp.]SCM82573.1 hypothetical protein KL86SPO_50344 [uncultured Sporomusa sp.]